MRKLEKINATTYALKTEDEKARLKTEKLYSKDELFDIYKSIKGMKEQLLMQEDRLKKELANLGAKDDPESIAFAEKLENAQKLLQKKKIEDQLKAIRADFESYADQCKEIKLGIPEIDRAKQ